jgi:hypothetical protein
MNDDPILFGFGGELLEILFEMFDHICADGVGLLTLFSPIGQGCQRGDPSGHPAFGVCIQGDL